MENPKQVRGDVTTPRGPRNPATLRYGPGPERFRQAAHEAIGILELLAERLTTKLAEEGEIQDRIGCGILSLVKKAKVELLAQATQPRLPELDHAINEAIALIELIVDRLIQELDGYGVPGLIDATAGGVCGVAAEVQVALVRASGYLDPRELTAEGGAQ